MRYPKKLFHFKTTPGEQHNTYVAYKKQQPHPLATTNHKRSGAMVPERENRLP